MSAPELTLHRAKQILVSLGATPEQRSEAIRFISGRNILDPNGKDWLNVTQVAQKARELKKQSPRLWMARLQEHCSGNEEREKARAFFFNKNSL